MSSAQRKFGCLMIGFDIAEADWKEIIDMLNPHADLYSTEDKKYGLEDEPHCTVLYGLHDHEVTLDQIKEHLPPISEMTAILMGVSHFECPEYDVLKFDIDAPKFHHANKTLRDKFPYTNEWPDYHPHMTIAYLNKGMGGKYGTQKLSVPLTPKHYKYGFADGRDEFFTK